MLPVSLFIAFLVICFTNYSECTKVSATVTIRCKHSYNPIAQVFLMEKDFSNSGLSWLDEDDTLDKKPYTFHQLPEQKIVLFGEDIEAFGIHSYLYVYHNCLPDPQIWKSYTLSLDKALYLDRKFDVVIDLDSGESKITDARMFNRLG